MISPCRAS